MNPAHIRMAVVNKELDTTIQEARSLVTQGVSKWVWAPGATLRLEPKDYELQSGEMIVWEAEENHFVPV